MGNLLISCWQEWELMPKIEYRNANRRQQPLTSHLWFIKNIFLIAIYIRNNSVSWKAKFSKLKIPSVPCLSALSETRRHHGKSVEWDSPCREGLETQWRQQYVFRHLAFCWWSGLLWQPAKTLPGPQRQCWTAQVHTSIRFVVLVLFKTQSSLKSNISHFNYQRKNKGFVMPKFT